MVNQSLVNIEMKTCWLAITMLTACLVPGLTGCGRGGGLPTYKTTGSVSFSDGKPLAGGTIVFESVDHPVTARSVIGLDGTFTLSTYDQGDGAVAGKHRVAISPAMNMAVDRDEVRAPRVIHPRYKDIDESGLEFEVKADGPNEFEVQVSPR